MSQIPVSSVYLGPWINHSRGLILGSTITLSDRNGALLTAFLAIFVSAAGSACWRIISYWLHQSRTKDQFADGIHHQQQATLRNSSSPGGAAWDFLQLMWNWRKNALRPARRTLPLTIIALLNLILFGLASIFSSEVTKAAGNETLVRPTKCGFALGDTNHVNASTKSGQRTFDSQQVNDTLAAAAYARSCYNTKTLNTLQCQQYAQPALEWKTNQNASCPFSSDLCLLGPTGAYELDSGRIDSHTGLGINAPKSQRIEYRRVTSCSPINLKGHETLVNDSSTNNQALLEVMLGSSLEDNFTFVYNMMNTDLAQQYTLNALTSFAGAGGQFWIPIPALNRTDADISIFGVEANAILYFDQVTDPLFAATTPYNNSHLSTFTYYAPDNPVTVLACTDQHQFCNPTTNKCTPLSGVFPLLWEDNLLLQLDLNPIQNLTAQQIKLWIQSMELYGVVDTRGGNSLLAQESVSYPGFQVALPNNQWQKEVSSWYAIGMAKLQQKIVQYSAGPEVVPDGYVLQPPTDKLGEQLCKNQIIRNSSGTISFSVLGVAIILIVGSLLILTNLVLDTIIGFIRTKLHWKSYKSLQWNLDHTWQLQRLAYEEAGQGHWMGGAASVPVTTKGDKIGVPRDVDPTHPRLSRAGGPSVTHYQSPPEAESLMESKGMSYRAEPI